MTLARSSATALAVLAACALCVACEKTSDEVVEHDVSTSDAARMYSMNLKTWRDDSYVRETYEPAQIDGLADLVAVARDHLEAGAHILVAGRLAAGESARVAAEIGQLRGDVARGIGHFDPSLWSWSLTQAPRQHWNRYLTPFGGQR